MRKTKLGQELITAMNEAITITAQPGDWTPSQIANLRRQSLKLSQPLFAAYLGASPGAVKAWEQGAKVPNGPTRRLMDMLVVDTERTVTLIKRSLPTNRKGAKGE